VKRNSVGFMSYVRFDDEHENGRLTEFCKRLSGEVRMQTGERFDIFQDRNDIAWGQQWKARLNESLDSGTFLIPIITPGFFKSPACREEFERFVGREKQLGRGDLILAVHYVNCPLIEDPSKRAKDAIATLIAGRQLADWRELRFEALTSPQASKMLARMAQQIVEALERESPAEVAAPARTVFDRTPGANAGAWDHRKLMAERPTDPAHGPALRTEPPTRIVDALHRGDHASVTAALNAANPGDRILVRPGLYREGLVIDKPVEIIGDGEVGEVVIEATGTNTVRFGTSMGRISNVTLRQTGGGDHYCVHIAQGRLDIEGCDISSQSLACVAIRNGADPRLRRNRIHDGKEGGVAFLNGGLGTLEDNEIFGHASSAVAIASGSNPTLRRNRIHSGKKSGVHIYDLGLGTFEDNQIVGNANAGVTVRSGGNPVFRRNLISKNGYEGLWIYEGGRGVFEENDLRDNARGAWDIEADCAKVVVRSGNLE
jgi:parallel beta-helix repeat protein